MTAEDYRIWVVGDPPEEPSEEFMRALEEMDPTYRQCVYCEGDVRVEEGSYEDHIREEHNLDP